MCCDLFERMEKGNCLGRRVKSGGDSDDVGFLGSELRISKFASTRRNSDMVEKVYPLLESSTC